MARKGYPPSVNPGKPVLGMCPEGWTKGKFKDLVKPVYRKAKLEDDETYQLVLAKRSRGGIVEREKLKGKQIKTKTQFFAHAGDFLISRRQIVHGACGIVPQELHGSIVSNEYSTLQPVNGFDLNYLSYFSHTPYFQQTCFHSSVGVDVEKMIFKLDEWLNKPVLIPPNSQQKKIVEILSCWDSAIENIEKLIDAKTRLKKGLIQRLIRKKGKNLIEFSEIAELRKGKYDPKKESVSLPCIELEHLSQETGEILGYVDGKQQGSTKNRFQQGDVLFGKLRPYLRKFAIPTFEGICSSEIWVLRGKKGKCLNTYLFYLVQTHNFIAKANATSGTKMPRADWKFLVEVPFYLPSLEEQEKVSQILQTLDKELLALQSISAQLRKQKNGLMQKLLTGRIRVQRAKDGNSEVIQAESESLRNMA